MIVLSARGNALAFSVRVTPRSSRDSIEGEFQGALKVRLTAPPVDNLANDALCRHLVKCLNLPVSAVRIVSGHKSRMKRVEVTGVAPSRIQSLA